MTQLRFCRHGGNLPGLVSRGSDRFSQLASRLAAAATFISVVLVLGLVGRADDLKWQTGPGYRFAEAMLPREGKTGFTLMPPHGIGITFTNLLAESRSLTNHILLNGSGIAAGDVDGDGWCDLYFCGIDGPNVLYRNLGGWKFQDITAQAGVACPGLDATGAVFADVDGDGDLDLLVSSVGEGTRCFLNNSKGHFHEVTAEAGLTSEAGTMSMTLADVDGDGDLDLYVANYRTSTVRDSFGMRVKVNVVQGKRVITMVNDRPVTEPDLVGRFSLDEDGNINENGEADVLYRNDGQGHFTAVSWSDGTFTNHEGKRLRLPPYDWGLTAMFRDLNGDGFPDLYVCNDMASPDRIWLNDGKGKLKAVSPVAFRKTSWFSMGMDFADLNRDGYDEILVTDMVSRDHRQRQVQVSNHKLVFNNPGVIDDCVQAPRNTLFLNLGDGDYSELAYFSGLDATEWSWAPIFLDVDLDGYEDALIVTGFERDVQDMDIANRLETIRQQKKLPDAEALRMRRMFPRLDQPNLAFRNRRDLTFEEVSAAWGFNTLGISQGAALADLDSDGDLDAIVNNMNGVAGVYRNDTVAARVAIRLRGQAPNTAGIGAKIWLGGGAVARQSQEIVSGGRYLSCDDTMRVFAAGDATNRMKLEVVWRSGKRSFVDDVRANCIYEINETGAVEGGKSSVVSDQSSVISHQLSVSSGQSSVISDQSSGIVPPASIITSIASLANPQSAVRNPQYLEDVSRLLNHTHHEDVFDEFARQPLLPRRLSQSGPGVSWYDVDGDGWDDLIIGSGKGGQLAVYRNDAQGGFARLAGAPLSQVVARDQTTVLGWRNAAGKPVLLAGSANYEDGFALGSCVRQFELEAQKILDTFPGQDWSAGPMALADVDGDGDLDLFVGGRAIGGKYPAAASSVQFLNEEGKWVADEARNKALDRVGLVSGAVFSDLDGDGYPELILACDWGPVRVFHNEAGKAFKETTQELGLDRYVGWWNGVTTGDLDGDGRPEIIASNWGQNSKYQAHREQPLRLYYGDFNGGGGMDLLEAFYDPPLRKVVPWQHLGRIGPALPFVTARFPTYREFGEASVEEILGEKAGAAKELRANWLETTVFLNRSNRFEATPMPLPAQLSPAFAVCIGDLDGDGNEDVFLSQNFFATEPETDRYDGGRGLWLTGDGSGALRALAGRESGVKVYGEQRGAAVCDYDGDGRLDLVVSQNAAATRLFHNRGAKPGLRVRLRGPAGNPAGVGGVIRLKVNGRLGPSREIHAGSGYWSQDSAVQVMALAAAPSEVWVRWPGGKTTTAAVPADAREIEVNEAGQLRLVK